jgi:hypothetical protein
MFRPFVYTLAVLTALPLYAQDKKDEKKEDKKVVIADPKELKDDAGYKIQGEYVAEMNGEKIGLQVIAQGSDEYIVKGWRSGLPGAGWNEKDTVEGTLKVTKDGATLSVSDKSVPVKFDDEGNFTMTMGDRSVGFVKTTRKWDSLGKEPPEGAVVLFSKAGDEKNWEGGKLVELSDGKVLDNGIKSKQAFGAFQAHIEFRLPYMPSSTGQGRGNSGVYIQDRYELQVLDSFGLSGENNECGGFYTLHKPSVNMCLPPMVWQTYDIDFTPAVFANGKKTKNARVSVVHNGVKIHDDVELEKETPGGQKEADTPGVLQFQNHGDPVYYRNIWVVEKK